MEFCWICVDEHYKEAVVQVDFVLDVCWCALHVPFMET